MRAGARLLLRAAALALTAVAAPAEARTLGLAFGVSAYPHFPPDKQLRAPVNDVGRMLRAFAARGLAESDFVILADGVPNARAAPTRAAILDALDALAAQAGRGDLAVIYGSGHGARQASDAARKSDGLDQLFLPADAAPDPADPRRPFRNAIVSTEFGDRIDRIRLKGADVWFILDSCFSGAASRAGDESVRDKSVEPAEIGVAAATALDPDKATPLAERPALPDGAGKLVAFYASQPNETAREAALPASAPLARRAWGSIFTLALAQALERGRGLSYRQTLVEAGRLLRADAGFQSRQTPSFEGDGLDAPAPGAALASEAALWRVAAGVALAGRLEGLEEGAVLALYDRPEAPPDAPLARARVVEAAALQARLAIAAPGCDPLRADCPAADPRLAARAAYARLIRPAAGATLRLAGPRLLPGAAAPAHAEAARAALAAATQALAGRVAQDDAAPDVTAWLTPAGLRLSPPGADPARLESGPSLPAALFAEPDRAVEAAMRALLRARQSLLLRRLAEGAGAGAQSLAVTVEARRFGADASGKCAFKGEGALLPEGAALEVCDKLVATLENQGREAVLPAVFFMDDGWNLIARRPACPVGLSVADRLEPGRRLRFEIPYHPKSISPGLAPLAVNGVVAVGVPFRPGEADLPNLCGLAAFNDGAGATRGDDDDLDALIGATRGGPRLPLEATTMSLTLWQVRQPVAR